MMSLTRISKIGGLLYFSVVLTIALVGCKGSGENAEQSSDIGEQESGELMFRFMSPQENACGALGYQYEVVRCGENGEILAEGSIEFEVTSPESVRSIHIPILDEDRCDCVEVRVTLENDEFPLEKILTTEVCEGETTAVRADFVCDQGAEGQIILTVSVGETPYIEIEDYDATAGDCNTPVTLRARVIDRDSDPYTIDLYVVEVLDADGNPLPPEFHDRVRITREEEATFSISIDPSIASQGGSATILLEAKDGEGNSSEKRTPITIYSECGEEGEEEVRVSITSHADGSEIPASRRCFEIRGSATGVPPLGPPFINVYALPVFDGIWYAQQTALIEGNNWRMNICVGNGMEPSGYPFVICSVGMDIHEVYPTTHYSVPSGLGPEATDCIDVFRE